MKKHLPVWIIVLGLIILTACETVPESVPEGLTSAELFQRAQEYADNANYEAALLYTREIMVRFEDEPLTYITAQYHEALYLQQSGASEEAASAYDEILARYENETGLPEWIRTLSRNKRAEIAD